MQNQSISLTQEQRLQMILAPQLRQSLELLQAPILELQHLIRVEAEQNPTLEVIDVVPTEPLEVEPNVQRDREDAMTTDPPPDTGREGETDTAASDQVEALDFSRELDLLSRMDKDESRYYFQNVTPEDEERRQYHYDSITQPVSLQEHLMSQLGFSELDAVDREIGELIIGSIDDRGYLVASPAELAQNAGYGVSQVKRVLHVVQEFDPPGIAAADLRECLLLQLQRMGRQRRLEYRIIDKHLDLLAAHKFKEIARRLDAPVEKVHAAAQFIATLHPRPGDLLNDTRSPVVVPEVVVRRDGDVYVVDLNDENLPRLRISGRYERLLRDESTAPEVKKYIAERIRAANYMIGSIGQRQRTLRRIAQEIVRVQTPFFDEGLSGLRPLTMARIAEEVGVHETTISRAVSGKYARTPRGVFELKYFFTTGVKMSGGTDVSNKYIQDQIAELVSNEDPERPLSDQDIVGRLQQAGYRVSRRTVNKYRMILKIPPSHLRRTGR